MPYSFGVAWIAPLIAGFCSGYPDVMLEVLASHVPLDMYEEDLDVALRLGALPDSMLKARKFGSFSTGIYASPAYLELHGQPESPEDLQKFSALALHQARSEPDYSWPLHRKGRKPKYYSITPHILASDPALIFDAALASQGLILAMDASMAPEVNVQRLSRVMPDWDGPPQDLHALYPSERFPLPKVRAFIEYLCEHLQFAV